MAKNSKVDGKKVGLAPTGRKALNDITNKGAPVLVETSSRRKTAAKEEQEINVMEEKFLHDHNKCIEAQKAAMNTLDLEMVLPNDGIVLCLLAYIACRDNVANNN